MPYVKGPFVPSFSSCGLTSVGVTRGEDGLGGGQGGISLAQCLMLRGLLSPPCQAVCLATRLASYGVESSSNRSQGVRGLWVKYTCHGPAVSFFRLSINQPLGWSMFVGG